MAQKMEYGGLELWVWVVILGGLSWAVLMVKSKQRNRRLPPGPKAWPIIGCVPSVMKLTGPPEYMFGKLAETHGELMLLKIGQQNVVVVSSARMAMEFLKTHDQEFANRPHSILLESLSFNDTSLLTMASGNPLFRRTRRIFLAEIASPRKVAAGVNDRKDQVLKMLRAVVQDLDAGRSINVTKTLSSLAIRLAMCLNFGSDYGDKMANETEVLIHSFEKFILIASKINLGDAFPAIRWLDLQGIEAELKQFEGGMRKSIAAMIECKRREMSSWSAEEIQSGANERDVMCKLLSMEGEDHFSEEQLSAVVFSSLFGGTDTTTKIITEAIHEVVTHPDVYKRALDELNAVVGTARLVDESDIAKLPFIQSIVKETLRLHPPAPIMLPHGNFQDHEVGGYHIPRNSNIIMNLIPIQRDPAIWDSPLEFCPDRFTDLSKFTVQGSDFNFIPFGYGKRQCPGINLGMATVQYVLAQCLHCISWQIPPGVERQADLSMPIDDDLVLDGKLRVAHRGLLDV